jgi:flagellar biosynthetic protein FliQ
MSDAQILDIAKDAFLIALKVAGPILAVALVIGVIISLLQTVTQIQEMTLTFVPKLIGTGLVVLLGGKWMLGELVAWMEGLWRIIPTL